MQAGSEKFRWMLYCPITSRVLALYTFLCTCIGVSCFNLLPALLSDV